MNISRLPNFGMHNTAPEGVPIILDLIQAGRYLDLHYFAVDEREMGLPRREFLGKLEASLYISGGYLSGLKIPEEDVPPFFEHNPERTLFLFIDKREEFRPIRARDRHRYSSVDFHYSTFGEGASILTRFVHSIQIGFNPGEVKEINKRWMRFQQICIKKGYPYDRCGGSFKYPVRMMAKKVLEKVQAFQ